MDFLFCAFFTNIFAEVRFCAKTERTFLNPVICEKKRFRKLVKVLMPTGVRQGNIQIIIHFFLADIYQTFRIFIFYHNFHLKYVLKF